MLLAESGAGSEDHKETQAGIRGKVCWESRERRCLDPPTWVSQETCPGGRRSSPTCMPTERAPQVGPSPGHSPGLRAVSSAGRRSRGAQSGAWLCVSQCGGGWGQQWACPGPQALPEPGVLPSAAPFRPGTLCWAWGRESDVTLDRPEDANASGPPAGQEGMGSDGEDLGQQVPVPRQQAWSYRSRHIQTEDSRAKQRGRVWTRDGPEPAHTFSKDTGAQRT